MYLQWQTQKPTVLPRINDVELYRPVLSVAEQSQDIPTERLCGGDEDTVYDGPPGPPGPPGHSKKVHQEPLCPCIFCNLPHSQLKRHILCKHKTEPRVVPLLAMKPKDQDVCIEIFRKEAIREHNLMELKTGDSSSFMRE